MTLYSFKLISGDNIISKVEEDEMEDVLILKDPLQVIINENSQVFFIPWLLFSKTKEIILHTDSIIHWDEVSPEAEKLYGRYIKTMKAEDKADDESLLKDILLSKKSIKH